MSDKMREEFEAWVFSGRSQDPMGKFINGDYRDAIVQAAWQGWQASRQALEVELPESFEMDDFEAHDAPDVIEAIRAAGIRIKGDL